MGLGLRTKFESSSLFEEEGFLHEISGFPTGDLRLPSWLHRQVAKEEQGLPLVLARRQAENKFCFFLFLGGDWRERCSHEGF